MRNLAKLQSKESGDKTPFERPRQSYEIILKFVEPNIHKACERVDWIDLNQNRGQERHLVYQGYFVTGLFYGSSSRTAT